MRKVNASLRRGLLQPRPRPAASPREPLLATGAPAPHQPLGVPLAGESINLNGQ